MISRRLFRDARIVPADIDALIGLGNEGIEPFRMALERDGSVHGVARREQIVDMLGTYKVVGQSRTSVANATVIALLASFINEPRGMIGANAVSSLVSYGSPAYGSGIVNLLLTALRADNCRTRSYAARFLGQCDDRCAIPERAIALLITALQDDDARVRSDAAEALGKLGDVESAEPLIHALADANWLVRESASTALACFGDHGVMDKLVSLMRHDEHRIRLQAMHTISLIGGAKALPWLVLALDDVNVEVQWEAIAGLGADHHRDAIVPLLAHYRQGDKALRQRIAAACKKIGINRVASELANADAHIRIACAEMLAEHGYTKLMPLIADAWQYETIPDVQKRIIISIGQLAAIAGENSPDTAIATLIHATENPDENISYYARKSLESLPHPLAEQFMRPPLQASKVAIACPSCLQTLQLEAPLTAKTWSCSCCHLDFTIGKGTDGVLVVSPATASLRSPRLSPSVSWFDVLQLNPDADVVIIKRAFRTLLKQYHPDRVATLGDEFKQLAEEKTRLLTWALRTGLKAREEG